MRSFESVCDFLGVAQPADPVICHRPHAAARAARFFLQHFPGDVLYAVKANPAPVILTALYEAGIRDFDVASPVEIDLVSSFPGARLYCMNPVKHPAHIRQAYFNGGVRAFALDTSAELEKILRATDYARDLELYVRIAVDNGYSHMPLEHKFGVTQGDAAALLMEARLAARELGVCFHVGSQAMRPDGFAFAVRRASQIIQEAGVIIDTLDVGGGFPAAYPDLQPPALGRYFDVISDAFADSLTSETCRLICEPGRALVAEAASLLVNVVLRKGRFLYINDGAYGGLFDAAHMGFQYPARAIRSGQYRGSGEQAEFALYGPTCDSVDCMPGPFLLPQDTATGDYLEIGQLGAYADSLRTHFNGFGGREEITVTDEPLLSTYRADAGQDADLNMERHSNERRS